ncbi:MAG: RidA family protein [Ignavibacteriaceae bacterium]
MSRRIKISSGVNWEDIYGYSRAVRVGNIVEVSGTTATEGDKILSPDDFYEQTKFILQKIEKVLIEAGAGLHHVVRTRTYTTDISQWQQIARAHSEFFGKIKPAATLLEVKSLIDPALKIEIEVTAVTD